MSDVRALLKAKRQEVRVQHPLASYTSTGQLRCVACGTIVKQAWAGHIGSKAHRVNVVKLKEQQQREEEEARREGELKRKSEALESDEDDEGGGEEEEADMGRDVDGDVEMKTHEAKKRKLDTQSLPADFFSDPSKAPPPPDDDGDDDDEGDPAGTSGTEGSKQTSMALDHEWEMFQRTVVNFAATTQADNAGERREAYERATIAAEPVLAEGLPEGFPPSLASNPGAAEPTAALDEEETRRQKELEERELIMDRLMDEEQAQEEADAKVMLLKNRLDALKRQRQAAKAARTKNKMD